MAKSQIDIATFVGSIVIPIAALIGSLIFAFSLLGAFGDAERYTAVVVHDVATLQDVAFSFPDTVTIRYTLPYGVCKYNFTLQKYICGRHGEFNLSLIQQNVDFSKINISNGLFGSGSGYEGNIEMPSIGYVNSYFSAKQYGIYYYIPVGYSSFAYMSNKFYGYSLFSVDDEGRVVIQKVRQGFRDAHGYGIYGVHETGMIYPLVKAAMEMTACDKSTDSCYTLVYVDIPEYYNLKIYGVSKDVGGVGRLDFKSAFIYYGVNDVASNSYPHGYISLSDSELDANYISHTNYFLSSCAYNKLHGHCIGWTDDCYWVKSNFLDSKLVIFNVTKDDDNDVIIDIVGCET